MSATAPIEAEFPVAGQVFAERYRVDRLIGRGGHSRVYSAKQEGFDRDVAVKILNPTPRIGREDAEIVEKRFYREARLLARLRGPNTLRVFDYGRTDSGLLFMVSELVEGVDLKQLLHARGALSAARAERIFTQILRGLLEVHSEGFLHRDIKPSNVMVFNHLGERDRVKLLDFGIAKSLAHQPTDETGLTMAGFVIGTPGYMSPEQARGEAMAAGSDVFSAGLIAYEMLTGRSPYMGLSLEQMQRSMRTGPPQLPGTVEVGREFAAVLHRCLAINVEARYRDAGEALRELGATDMDSTDEDARDDETSPTNILTFPLHLDLTGTTAIDTLRDPATGQTTRIALPESSPVPAAKSPTPTAQAPVAVVGPQTRTEGIGPARRSRAPWFLVGLVIACAIVLMVWAITSTEGPGGSSEGPSVETPIAVRAASDVVGRAARNAELDAVIAAKEATLHDDKIDEREMEFEERDEPESPRQKAPPSRPTKLDRPAKKAEKHRAPRVAPAPVDDAPEPTAKQKPKPDFDVEMIDDL